MFKLTQIGRNFTVNASRTANSLSRTANSLNRNETLIDTKEKLSDVINYGVGIYSKITNTSISTFKAFQDKLNSLETSSDEYESSSNDEEEIPTLEKTSHNQYFCLIKEIIKINANFNLEISFTNINKDHFFQNIEIYNQWINELKEHLDIYKNQRQIKLSKHLESINAFIEFQEELKKYQEQSSNIKTDNLCISTSNLNQNNQIDELVIGKFSISQSSLWMNTINSEKKRTQSNLTNNTAINTKTNDNKITQSSSTISSIQFDEIHQDKQFNRNSKQSNQKEKYTLLYLKCTQAKSKQTINSSSTNTINTEINSELLESFIESIDNIAYKFDNSTSQSTYSKEKSSLSSVTPLYENKKSEANKYDTQISSSAPNIHSDNLKLRPQDNYYSKSQNTISPKTQNDYFSTNKLIKLEKINSSSEETIFNKNSSIREHNNSSSSIHPSNINNSRNISLNNIGEYPDCKTKKIKQSKAMTFLSFFACGSCKSKKS
jgi:hypothetical protein